MVKYLKTAGFVVLYLAIMYGFTFVVRTLWFGGLVPQSFAFTNYLFFCVIAFLLTLAAYSLIFKLRKKSLIKTCNFSKLSAKNFAMSVAVGALFGIFTSSLCNTSYIIKNVPSLEQYVINQLKGSSFYIEFLIVIAVIFAFEEIIFRGVIFNEIRNSLPTYKAVIATTAVYGLINAATEGWNIALMACFAAFFYNLAYVYMKSMFSSIIIQIVGIYVITINIKTPIWLWLRGLGDNMLLIPLIGVPVLLLTVYYFMYKDFKGQDASQKAAAFTA